MSNDLTILLIGNIISLVGALIMVSLGLVKDRKKVLILQCIQSLIMGVGNLVLGGVSGFASNLVTVGRNVLSFYRPLTWPIKLIIIAAQVIIPASVNTNGWVGWLPIIACVIFTCFVDVKSDSGMKVLCFTTQILWAIYDFNLMNFTALAFDIMALVSNTVGFIRIKRSKV